MLGYLIFIFKPPYRNPPCATHVAKENAPTCSSFTVSSLCQMPMQGRYFVRVSHRCSTSGCLSAAVKDTSKEFTLHISNRIFRALAINELPRMAFGYLHGIFQVRPFR